MTDFNKLIKLANNPEYPIFITQAEEINAILALNDFYINKLFSTFTLFTA